MSNSYLISGSDYLKNQPNFNLIGRDEDLNRIISILVRNSSSSVILSGPRGVGCEALVCGIQNYKSKPDVPFDVVSKRLFWLDGNSLFSSGDSANINVEFQKIMRRLEKTTNSILTIEDTKDFLESARNSGCSHFVNSIVSAVRKKLTQVILICSDDNLEYVLKAHNDFFELFTLMNLEEPTGKALKAIVNDAANALSNFHGIKYSTEAVAAAIKQTSKYLANRGLDYAQPQKSITVMDRAFSSYKIGAHKNRPNIISEDNWADYQNKILRLYREQREDEDIIVDLTEKIESLLTTEKTSSNKVSFESLTSISGIDTPEVENLRKKIKATEADVVRIKDEFNKITSLINDSLLLSADEITQEFSNITGIPVDKLNRNDSDKLRVLEPTLLDRIYGQNRAINRVANAIKISKIAPKNDGKPLAAFMFLGPSGCGKTETAKAIASALYDDDNALLRFDMSEYMEKHSVAKLIGAPPGYDGFEAGGILTNAIRKNGNRTILFDEFEKAHPDVFNILLQVLSAGRLTDSIGRTVDFSNTLIILTSNIGQEFFLDENISDEQAITLGKEELDRLYRSELLNRFNGRENIIWYNRLTLESIVKIVKREIASLNTVYNPLGVKIEIELQDLEALCKAKYNAKIGARGLPAYLNVNIEPTLANGLLEDPPKKGSYYIKYQDSLDLRFEAT